MRKFCCFITVLLLLLLSGALAEAPQASADLKEARALADNLQERFGITILIGDECDNAISSDSFTVIGDPPARTPLFHMLGFYDYSAEVRKLEDALELYPPELFPRLRDTNAPNGLRILIADRIDDTNPEMNSIGYATCDSSYYNVVLAHTFFRNNTVHHEIWHIMEMVITAGHPDAFLLWDAFNPDGFTYTGDYTANPENFDEDFFASGYGTINDREDRATIAEAVFREDRDEWFASRPAIRRKLNAMNLALKDTLIIQYNVK